LYATLPSAVAPGTRILVPVLEMLLLLPLIGVNPLRFTRETRWSRAASLGLVVLIAVANLVSLGFLVRVLVKGGGGSGGHLLLAALQIWATNILVFGLGYWEIDRGGPVRRGTADRKDLPAADFRFSQDENDDAVGEVAVGSSGESDWRPRLIDYMYLSVTNSTAFSPTDTMPLSSRTKAAMSLQSLSAFLISVLVIAKAVGSLG